MPDSTPTAWLTSAELQQLTDRRQAAAQRRALDAMHIPYRVSLNGHPLVERRRVLSYAEPPQRTRTRPDWDALKQAS